MSSDYDGSSPQQRLRDISERLALIDSFTVDHTRETFVADVKTRLAVVRLLEEIRARHPEVDFATFGCAGNIYRHQYGAIDYRTVWDDLRESSEMRNLRFLLQRELES